MEDFDFYAVLHIKFVKNIYEYIFIDKFFKTIELTWVLITSYFTNEVRHKQPLNE